MIEIGEPRDTPSSSASCANERPLVFDSWTASRLKASEYGGVLGIDRHPSRPTRWVSRQVSTKAGELQVRMATGAPADGAGCAS